MKTATIPATSLREGQQRLKPNFYLNAGKLRLDRMRYNGHPMSTIGEQSAAVYRSDIFKRQFVSDPHFGLPYISGANIMKAAPRESSRLISAKYTPNMEETSLKTNQILVTCAGTVGNVRLVTADLEGVIGSQDIIRVDCSEQKLPYGFLYAYLASPTVHDYMQSLYYGSVVPRIEPFHVRQIPVPQLPAAQMQQIHADIQQAAQLREDAARLLAEADNDFLTALQLEPGELHLLASPNERNISATRILKNSAVNALTLRGRNYGLRLEKIITVLKKGQWQPLEELLQTGPYYTGRFKRLASTAPTAVELYSQGDLFALQPKGQIISARTVPNDVSVTKGSILVAGVGTLGENEIFGRAKFVWGYLENKLVAQHIIRFVPNEKLIDEGYLFTVLNSKLWFRIFRSSVCGTSLLSFIIPLLNTMPVPRIGNEIEQEIGRKVKLAYEKLTEAIVFESQAIHTVETAISAWQK